MSATRKAFLATAVAVAVVVMIVLGGGYLVLSSYIGNVDRIPWVFAGLDESRRPPGLVADKTGAQPTVFLLVGIDAREGGQTTGTEAAATISNARADTIMIARIAGTGEGVDLVSIPRDSWVDIPGHGMNKINAAFAFGGPTLLVQTVEQLTGVRIDHFAAIDFYGFKNLTDALGGVKVDVPSESTNLGYVFSEGEQLMDGDQALAYVRQRYGLSGGDFDRIRRQQSYLMGVVAALRERDLWNEPAQVGRIASAITKSLSVDNTLNILDTVNLVRNWGLLNPERISMALVPVSGTGWEGRQSVVYLDHVRGLEVWSAFASGGRETFSSATE
jgi:LCP family protein required for cell wall assembly